MSAANAYRFILSAPSSDTAGTALIVNVTALDFYNNTASGYTGTIQFSSSDSQAALPANSTLTDGAGSFIATLKTVGSQTLTATDTTNGVLSNTSNSITVSVAAASQLVITQQPSTTATAGVVFAMQPVVKEEDAYGNVITTDSTHMVTAATGSQGTASLQGSNLTVTLINGVATFSGLSYDKAETMNIAFTTSASGVTSATSNSIVVSPATASQLVITQQPSATATAGVNFATQPVVEEEDQFGNVITTDSTHTVTAATGSHGTGTLQGSTLTLTLNNGVAAFSGLSYNVAEAMNLAFTTNAGGFTTTSNDVAVSAATASQLVITQQPSATATAGVAFATQPVVKEEDQFGNVIITDSTHTVTVARGSHGTGTLQGSTLTVTLSNGVATFSGLSYNVAETMNLAFTTNAGGFTATSTDVVVSPATATQLVITQQPSSTATAGVFFATQPVVKEEDGFGNVLTTDSTHTVTVARGSHGTGTLQGSTLTVTLSNGVATFSGLSYNVAETMNLAFTTTAGGFTATSTDVVVSPANATQLVITQQPSATAMAGVAFATQPVVKEEDAFGNVITTDSTHTVTAARGSQGTSTLQGSNLTLTLVNGVASFSGLSYNVAEFMNITFTTNAVGLAATTSNTLSVSSASASQLVVTQQPSATATAGVAFATQPVVKEEDQFGNVVTADSTHTVTAARGTQGTASLQGSNLTVTLINGVATFSGLSYDKAETMNLAFTSNLAGVASATSNSVVVSPANATHFGISAPNSTTADAAFDITVTALDAFGNTATAYTGTVTFTKSDSGSGSAVPLDYTFTKGTGNDNGVHTFINAVTFVTVGAGSQRVTATDTANSGITGQALVTVTAATATHFSISAPSSTMAGAAFGVTVTALDAFGNIANNYGGTVLFTKSDNGSGSAVPMNYTFTTGTGNDDGVHTFINGVTFVTVGSGSQTLTATDTTTKSITGSTSVAVSAANVSHLTLSAPSSTSAGTVLVFTVTALDPFNNTASSYNGTVHFTSSDSQAVLRPNSALTNGVGNFTATLETAGSQTLTATDITNSSFTATSNPIAVSAANATHFSVSAPANTTAGTAFSITVTALDAFDNTAQDYTGTVHFTKSDSGSGATVPADYAFTTGTGNDNGVHTFSNGVTLVTAATQTLTATDTSTSTIAGTANVTVSAANATHYAVTTSSSSLTAGTAVNVTVTALDAFGNTAIGYTGTVQVTSSDHQASLPSNSTLTNGTSTFSATLKTAGSQTITATDTATSSITGTSTAVNVAAAAFNHFQVSAPTSTVIAGAAFNFTVATMDTFNNTVSNYGGIVHFTSSDSAASLPVDSNLTNGIGTFSATLNTSGSQTVTATDTVTGSLTGTSNVIAVQGLIITTSGGDQQSTTVNTMFAAPLMVTVTDANGNVVPNVTVTFAGPGSGAGATFVGGNTATTNSAGQADKTVTANGSAGSYTVTASVAGVQMVSFTLTNIPGSPAAVTVTSGGAQSALVNTVFASPLVVTVTDESGNPIPNVTVTFAGPSGGAGVTFSGGNTITTNSAGQAEETVIANSSAGSYTVTASVSGVFAPAAFSLTNNGVSPPPLSPPPLSPPPLSPPPLSPPPLSPPPTSPSLTNWARTGPAMVPGRSTPMAPRASTAPPIRSSIASVRRTPSASLATGTAAA